MTVDTIKLTQDLQDATVAGGEAARLVDDNGSCNLDHVVLLTGKTKSVIKKAGHVENAIKAADVHQYYAGRKHAIIGYHLRFPFNPFGQASKRTAAVKAAAKLLTDRGWDVSIHYQLD